MSEMSQERLVYRESWREKIRSYIAGKAVEVAEKIDNNLFEEADED